MTTAQDRERRRRRAQHVDAGQMRRGAGECGGRAIGRFRIGGTQDQRREPAERRQPGRRPGAGADRFAPPPADRRRRAPDRRRRRRPGSASESDAPWRRSASRSRDRSAAPPLPRPFRRRPAGRSTDRSPSAPYGRPENARRPPRRGVRRRDRRAPACRRSSGRTRQQRRRFQQLSIISYIDCCRLLNLQEICSKILPHWLWLQPRPVSPAPTDRPAPAPASVQHRRGSSRHPFARPAAYHIRNYYYRVNSNVAKGSLTAASRRAAECLHPKG